MELQLWTLRRGIVLSPQQAHHAEQCLRRVVHDSGAADCPALDPGQRVGLLGSGPQQQPPEHY